MIRPGIETWSPGPSVNTLIMSMGRRVQKCLLCHDMMKLRILILYIYIYIYIYIYKVKVKLATIVEGNPKAPFSIATTPRCRRGRYSFPGLLYFTLDPYLIMLSVKQGGIKYHFLSLWYDSTWD